jgi:protein-export membrane protein SecD
MTTKWWIRFVILLGLTTGAVMMVAPTALNLGKDSSFPVKSKVNLGLDLQGGLYMVLGIDFNKVYRGEVINMVRKAKEYLDDQGIASQLGETIVENIEDPKKQLIVTNPSQVEEAKQKVKEYYQSRYIRLTAEEGGVLTYGIHHLRRDEIENESVDKSIEVIRNRIDEFGVTEPEITSQGEDRIVVQLPGVKEIERAKELIGKTAKLEFKMVNEDIPFGTVEGWVKDAETKLNIKYERGKEFSKYLDAVNNHNIKNFPKGFELAFQRETNNKGEVIQLIPFLVESESNLSGDDLQDASTQVNQQENRPYVALSFKSRGANVFSELTGKNVGKRMAITLDGNVVMAPSIREQISGGRASIEMGAGNFNDSMKEASDLALVLRAGALPVQLEFQEQRIVGPQLGEDSIVAAEKASLIGIIMIFLFILVYYKMSGLIALTTLVLNVLFVMACLVGLEATLTLPGIAGIALTVGMAIDASIIIYERIREEVRKEVGYYKAVESGFQSAFWTIIDANITTALAGLCLLNFGTGPIRGFAVTLLIGIIATVYSSYVVGNLLFQLYMNRVSGEKLSI